MVDRRKSLHHDVIASSRGQFPEMLSTEIPYSSEIERMSLRREPLSAYSPRGAVGQIYSLLWKEIATRMQRSPGAAPASADSVELQGSTP
jgi:cellulose biosynthesis protein BcsQ